MRLCFECFAVRLLCNKDLFQHSAYRAMLPMVCFSENESWKNIYIAVISSVIVILYEINLSVWFYFACQVASVLQKMKQQTQELFERRRPVLISALRDFGDFYMELKWEFHSWGELFCEILLFT